MSTVGIDLGTTNSLIGGVIDGELRLFADTEGRVLLPSVVGASPGDGVIVGRRARNRRLLDPEGTSCSVKRSMGTDAEVRVGVKTLSPPEVSALILAALLDRAEEQLGARPRRAVITVPAYFNDRQRQATRDAAEIAGLELERLVNEPTAAALTHQSGEEELVLVYDLGGGTFDVSLLERDEGFMEVRASHGDTQLGGDDIDSGLVELVLERLGRDGARVRADSHAMTRLTESVERAKVRLSSELETRLVEPFIVGEGADAVNLDLSLAREDVEAVVEPLLERTLGCIDRALEDAGVKPEALDRILLVGGSSQIPRVAQRVEAHLDMPVTLVDEPELAVARGASLLAGRASGAEVDEVVVDIAPHTLAAGVVRGYDDELFSASLIPRGTVIPTEKRKTFYTQYEDQSEVLVPVAQGEARMHDDNTELGEVEIEDLPPSPEGSAIEVIFRLDLSGILHVTATHVPSGQRASATIKHGPSRLTASERRRAKQVVAELREAAPSPGGSDQGADTADAPSSKSAQRSARAMLRRAQRVLKDGAAEGMAGEDGVAALERLEQLTQALEEALAAAGPVDELSEQLAEALYELG